MTAFVLDNSVAMRWLLQTSKISDQKYSEKVLKSLIDASAIVPNLWHLEATNVLLGVEKKSEVSVGEIERFLVQLESLPITVDPLTANQSFSHIMALSRAYKLSSYDAAYLELSIRERLPLASLDKGLVRAAKKADVEIYLR